MTSAVAVEKVLEYDAGALLDLRLLGGFCTAVQDALKELTATTEKTRAVLQEEVHASLHPVVRTIVKTKNQGGKLVVKILTRDSTEKTLRRYYTTWVRWGRRRLRVKRLGLCEKNTGKTMKKYFTKLQNFRKRAITRCRGMRALIVNTMMGKLRAHYLKLAAYKPVKEMIQRKKLVCTEGLLVKNTNLVLAGCYKKLARFEALRSLWKEKRLRARLAMVNNGKILCEGYYKKWAAWTARRGKVRKLERENVVKWAKGFWRKLRRFEKIRKTIREKEDVIGKLAEMLLRNNKDNSEALLEVKLESDARMTGLSQKIDVLGAQVDVGLCSLSNTNNVLNKMVDRLLSVDEHLDLLHKEKVSRTEVDSLNTRNISPARKPPTTQPEDPLTKQRTTFVGYSGVISTATATTTNPVVVPTANRISPPRRVVSMSAASSAGAVSAHTEQPPKGDITDILKRFDRPVHPPVPPSDETLSKKTQRELDTLRVRELERRLGIGNY